MSILFAASELEAFSVTGPAPTIAGGLNYDALYSRGAILILDTTQINAAFAANSSVWFHSYSFLQTSNNNAVVTIYSGLTPVVRLFESNITANTFDFQYWDGTWVDIETSLQIDEILANLDIYVDIHASTGSFVLYQADIEISRFDGDTTQSGASTVDNVDYSRQNISQVLIQTTSTLNAKVFTLYATADGALTDWSGSYADIDEVILVDNSDYVGGAAAEDDSTYVMSNPTTPTDYEITGLIHSVFASIGSGGPQNLQIGSYIGSTLYPSSNLSGIDLSTRPFQYIEETDPSTSSLPWDDTSVASMQQGFRAKA